MTPQEALKLKARARLRLQQSPATPPEQSASTLGNLKQFGVGLGKGAIGLAGLPGDIANYARQGMGWAAEKMGASPETANVIRQPLPFSIPGFIGSPAGSADIRKKVETLTGPFRQAQNVTEEYADTLGQFAPAAIAGPGGIARKAAMTAIPALASETGGQLTKGTEAEPYVRLATALAGGAVAAGRGGSPLAQLRKNAPDLATVGRQTDTAYARLRNAGIQYDPNSYRSFAMKTLNAVRKHGWRPRDGDPITSDLKEILGRLNKPNDFAEMENLRQFVGNLPKTASNTDMARAGIIKDALTDFIDNGKVISTKGLNPALIATMTKQARELGRKNILGKKIAAMGDKSQWYLGGEESGLRNQVASFGKQQNRSLTPTERDAFKKVVRREGVQNVLHTTGSRIGQMALGGATLAGGGGIPLALGAMGLNLGARKLSEAKTRKAINDALKTVLAGRPAQKAAMAAGDKEKLDALVRTLLATEAGRSSAVSHGQ